MIGQPTVVLRLDAGPTVGLGHLQRTLGLAVALSANGCSCVVRAPDTGDVRARVESLGLHFDSSAGSWSVAEETAALDRLGADALVIDSYEALEEDFSTLRRAVRPLVVIDDLAGFPISCDVIVNGAVTASDLAYERLAPGARLLLGPEYVLLHFELWDVTPRPPAEQVETVLVTCGGSSDSVEPLGRLLATADRASAPFDFTVAAPEGVAATLERFIGSSERQVTVLSPRSTVREAATNADLALASAGGTTRELLRLGMPTLAVVTAGNQRHGAIGLSELGAVELFQSIAEAEAGVAQALDELIDSYASRRRLAERGPQVVDGQGCRRVAAEVMELLA